MLNRRQALLTAGASMALGGNARAHSPEDADQRLTAAFDDFFATELRESPELATAFGLDKGPLAGAKSKLSGSSQADIDRRRRETAAQLARLRGIDRKPLTGMAAVNLWQ